MPELTPRKAESIRDVVAPQEFDSVQLWLKLPTNATPKEHDFYQKVSKAPASRAGGGNYPTLDICLNSKVYENLVKDLRENSRLVHTVIFQRNPEGYPPYPTPVEAYLLQGAEQFKSDLI